MHPLHKYCFSKSRTSPLIGQHFSSAISKLPCFFFCGAGSLWLTHTKLLHIKIFLKSMIKFRSKKMKQSTKQTFLCEKFQVKRYSTQGLSCIAIPGKRLFILCILSSFYPNFKFLFSFVVQRKSVTESVNTKSVSIHMWGLTLHKHIQITKASL